MTRFIMVPHRGLFSTGRHGELYWLTDTDGVPMDDAVFAVTNPGIIREVKETGVLMTVSNQWISTTDSKENN